MKKTAVLVALCLALAQVSAAQVPAAPSLAKDVETGTSLGNIIKTVIGIVLPSVQPLVQMLFPANAKNDDSIKLTRKELQAKLDAIQRQTQGQIKDALKPATFIAAEVVQLRQILVPCIELQDYLREVSVLAAGSPIPDAAWKRVRDIWPLAKQRVRTIADEKSCDIRAIRNREVQEDLAAIIGVGKGTKLERLELDYLGLSAAEINKGDLATRFRMETATLLELYQTVQMILVLSLQQFETDFSGAYQAIAGGGSASEKGFHAERIVEQREESSYQDMIARRLDGIIRRLRD